MNFKELNSKNLLEISERLFRYNKQESWGRYHKFSTNRGFSIVVFFNDYTKTYKWFFQNDPTKKYDIVDGIKVFNLWTEADVLRTQTIGEVDISFHLDNKQLKPLQKGLVKTKTVEYIDIGQFKKSLRAINYYYYHSLTIHHKVLINAYNSIVFPTFLFHQEKKEFQEVGFVVKHPSGFKQYIGKRGLVIYRIGDCQKENCNLIIGENIIDIFSLIELKHQSLREDFSNQYKHDVNSKNLLLIATHGSITMKQLITLKAIIKLYKIKEIFTAFDNDKAGSVFREKVSSHFNAKHLVPIEKDFFDDFKKDKKEKEKIVPF